MRKTDVEKILQEKIVTSLMAQKIEFTLLLERCLVDKDLNKYK